MKGTLDLDERDVELMKKNGITPVEYMRRIRSGWTHPESVLVPQNSRYPEILTEGLFPVTRREVNMIYYSNNTIDTYRCRRAIGWSKEKALKTPKR